MNILITAGGTSERIDSVRRVTNAATGALGSLVAEAFAASGRADRILYVCGKEACRPKNAPVEVTAIGDTAELEAALRKILAAVRVDAVIHSMAVSDYRVRCVSSAALAARALAEIAKRADSARLETEELASLFAGALENPPALASQQTKISSGEKNLILFLDPVQKIISLFRELAPDAILVGFKLLDHAPHDALIGAGFDLLEKNHCAFVLANDMMEISGTSHSGCLIDAHKNVRRFEGKKEIAEGIVESVLREFTKRNAG